MISKELLSEVLRIPIESVMSKTDWSDYGELLVFSTDYQHGHINIYELAHRCKEWILAQGYEIAIFAHIESDKPAWELSLNYGYKSESEIGSLYDTGFHNSESETIFAACEWILKEPK